MYKVPRKCLSGRGSGSGGEEVCIKCRGSVLVAEEVGRVLEEVVLGGEEVCIKCRGSVLLAEEVGRVLEEVFLGVRKCVYSAEEVPQRLRKWVECLRKWFRG